MNNQHLEFIRKFAHRLSLSVEELQEKYGPFDGDTKEFKQSILATNLMTESEFLEVWASYLKVPFLTEIPELPPEFLNIFCEQVPHRYANHHLFTPVEITEDTIRFAITDFIPSHYLAEISGKFGKDFDLAVSNESLILNAIQNNYGKSNARGESSEDVFGDDEEFRALSQLNTVETENLLSSEDEEPIRKIVNAMLFEAMQSNASDVHIDATSEHLIIRNRVDGVLQVATQFPKHGHMPIINRIKVMSGLDISVNNRPQDGRFVISIGQRKIDVRVSILPTIYGQRAVMRLLLQGHGLLELENLGLQRSMMERIKHLTHYPNGIVLVVGPTGSGKTTTLYAILQQFDASVRNIITIEDPVEYNLTGLGQIQVNPKVGLTFSSGLRSILRQDPDVIMVGEMRDQETAGIAIQASLTGHLVLSTLHTNDSPSTIVRLLDMGIESYLIGSTIRAIISQRLVRRICRNCKEKKELEWEYFKRFGLPESLKAKYPGFVYVGKGCDKCFHSGYRGRIGIYELMPINDAVKKVIRPGVSSAEISEVALQNQMIPLAYDGCLRVFEGKTTVEELIRTVFIEEEEMEDETNPIES